MTNGTIYVIDDDPDFCLILSLALKPYDLIVETFSEVLTFTNAVKDKKPDLCIVDLNLSSTMGEGFQLVKAMRNVIGDVLPIIIMSRRGDQRDVVKAMEVGASDFVAKPLDDAYLLSKLKGYFPKNKKLLQIDIPLVDMPKKDREVLLEKNLKIEEVYFESIIVSAECLLGKESLIWGSGTKIKEIFGGELERVSFKVEDSWNEKEKYYARLSFECKDQQFYNLRKWMFSNIAKVESE